MKCFALTAAALVAVASAANCDLAGLAPVVTGANGATCTKDSGLSFLPPSLPTAEQVPKLCASTACRAFLVELKKAAPVECTVDISTPKLELYAQLLTPLEKTCGPAPGAANVTAPAGNATSKAPEATSKAPAATSKAPAAGSQKEEMKAGSGSGHSAATEVSKAPKPTSAVPTPTPTPKSGAATAVAAASAVAVAVAASLF